MATDPPALLLHWERTVGDLLDRTRDFPKAVRFTFATRIDGLCLDVLELLAEARYADVRTRAALLRQADGRLARLRVLLRLAHERRYLARSGFEHAARGVDEAGRMLGGWRSELADRD